MSGQYEFHNGKILFGGIERNKLLFKWVQDQDNAHGWTTLYMNEDGTRLTGIWCHNENWNDYGFWIFWRKKGTPFQITLDTTKAETLEPTNSTSNVAVVKSMTTELKQQGKLILYGINFKYNSDELLTASTMVLNNLAALLISNEKISVRIEGHTDDTGTESFNLALSSKRAESVKRYLVSMHQIDAKRLVTVGVGEAFPISTNTTETGKATNRRVEIHQL